MQTVVSLLKMKANAQKLVISLACVSSETHNLQPIFLHIHDTKGCQAFLAETVEIGNMNNCCVTEAMHVLRRKLRKE